MVVVVVVVVVAGTVVVEVAGTWADAIHGVPPSIVPAASVAGTAAAAITAQRTSGEGCRPSVVGFWVICSAPCSLDRARKAPREVWGYGDFAARLPT